MCSWRGHWQKSSSPREVPSTWTARWQAHSTGSPGPSGSAPGGTPSNTHSAPPDFCVSLMSRAGPVPWAGSSRGTSRQPGQGWRPPKGLPRAMLTGWCPTASWAESSAEPGPKPAVRSAAYRATPTASTSPTARWSRRHQEPLEMRSPSPAVGLPTRLCL